MYDSEFVISQYCAPDSPAVCPALRKKRVRHQYKNRVPEYYENYQTFPHTHLLLGLVRIATVSQPPLRKLANPLLIDISGNGVENLSTDRRNLGW
jgi:hypothetical protein